VLVIKRCASPELLGTPFADIQLRSAPVRVVWQTPLTWSIRMKKVRNNKGFTLIELMIVVVIIGILAAIAIPRFSGATKQAKASEADGPVGQLCTLASAYYERYGTTAGKNQDDLKNVGWGTQEAKYWGFIWVGGAAEPTTYLGTATADGGTEKGAKLNDLAGAKKVMNCVTRDITPSGM
jgi:prepilin-type N-terminal cleavage/methylation domain-containing protein